MLVILQKYINDARSHECQIYCRHPYAAAACSPEMSVYLYQTTWHHNCNDSNVRVQDTFKISKTDQSHTTPGGMTSVIQTLDICTRQAFKASLKHQYTEWMECGNNKPTLLRTVDQQFSNCANRTSAPGNKYQHIVFLKL